MWQSRAWIWVITGWLCLSVGSCDGNSVTAPPNTDVYSGGETTVFDVTQNAFGYPLRNLPINERTDFFAGNSFFMQNWVSAPSSTSLRDGLGPLFNARSCSSCHFKDGRGRPPELGEPVTSLLFRLSVAGASAHGAPAPEPVYGGQLQNYAIQNVMPEGTPHIAYIEVLGEYPDGTKYSLRRPIYSIENLGYGSMRSDVMISPRTAPQMIGMGLLEAIPEAAIRSNTDESDANGDGISGRVNEVWDEVAGAFALGRFGWKANQPTVAQQVAGAFNGDMGITSDIFPVHDITASQSGLDTLPKGGMPEIGKKELEQVIFYSRTLAVPAARSTDSPNFLRGKQMFALSGCAGCHIPQWTTGDNSGISQLRRQIIFPYTDLLLHDMGNELADGRPDFRADGNEWRTPPLWGIGLIPVVNHHTNYLHDGRARSIEEAILWHGGESTSSRDKFKSLPANDRAALVQFVQSL